MAHTSGREFIESYLDSFASGDPKSIAAHVTEGFVNEHFGYLGAGCVTREAYTERLKGFLSTFKDLSYQPQSIVVNGTTGAARYIMRFEHDGHRITINGMMWFELSDGLISRRIDCWDSLSYLNQIKSSAEDIVSLLTR